MKKMIIAAAMFLLGGTAHAVSTTTILGLTLPAYGSYRWDLPMNVNSQLLDSLVAVKAATQTFTGANTFVSTSNVYYGSGSNLSGVATSAQLTSTAAALSSEITRATARENAIAVSTGVLQADLATEVSRATLRENNIAVSTGALELSKVNRAGDSMTGTLTMAANQYFTVGDNYTLYGKLNNRAYLSGYEGATLGARNNGTADGSFEYLVVSPLGNVGIGTTIPGTKLEVVGNSVSSGTVYARDGFYGNGATFSGDVTAGSNGLTAGPLTVSSITATTAVGVTTYNYGATVKASGGHGVNSSSFAMSDSSMTYSCAGGGCGFYGMHFDSSKHITFSPGNVLAATFQEDGGFTSVSSITANTFYGNGANLTGLPASGIISSTFTIDLHSGGDVFIASGSIFANPGMAYVNSVSTMYITGIQCYTLYSSSYAATVFNIMESTDTGLNTGVGTYLVAAGISVPTSATYRAKYSDWTAPDVNPYTALIVPSVLSLQVTTIPTKGVLPAEYGCTIKYWRYLDR